MKRVFTIFLTLCLALLTLNSCTSPASPAKTVTKNVNSNRLSPQGFLDSYNIKTDGEPARFNVTIPETWEFEQGAYPEGLYWALANLFSKDAGLDLTPLKGKTVEVWRYALKDGLPGRGQQNEFKYPSKVVLLVNDNQVAGAWLTFNSWGVGPSVKLNYLEDITGLSYEDWFYQQNLLTKTEKNQDLKSMGPVEVLDAFCKAIEAGDAVRVNACMSPKSMLDSLTVNLPENALYHPDYNRSNSFIGNLLEAKLLSYRLMDSDTKKEINSIGNRTKVEIDATMQIKWADEAFNSPDGKDSRFAVMQKYPDGWKLLGLGTGP